jgi:hypothetical protein
MYPKARLLTIGVGCLALTASACRGKHGRIEIENEPPAAEVTTASSFRMNDPAAAGQLLKGVYGIESGSWRWTAGHFSLLFRRPPGAEQKGAKLTLGLTVPGVVLQKLPSVSLTASINGSKLGSAVYGQPGSFVFTADVGPALLAGNDITVDFALDRSIPPNGRDGRELGIILTSAGLESK